MKDALAAKIGLHGIQIRGEFGTRVVYLKTGDLNTMLGSSAQIEYLLKGLYLVRRPKKTLFLEIFCEEIF